MKHVVIFVCVQILLQRVLCYSSIYMILKIKVYIASDSASPPNEKLWVIHKSAALKNQALQDP